MNETKTILGEGTVFEGNLYVKGYLQIMGKFQGEIKTEHCIEVCTSGKVKSDLHSKQVIIAGTLIGDIKATEVVEVKCTARILGNISTPKLHIENGSVLKGEIEITNQAKDLKKIIENSFESTPSFDTLGLINNERP